MRHGTAKTSIRFPHPRRIPEEVERGWASIDKGGMPAVERRDNMREFDVKS